MTINTDEHEAIQDCIDQFLTKLEEMGVANALLCYSCNISEHGIGWTRDYGIIGDPAAAEGLAQSFLDDDDGDEGVVFVSDWPDDDGGARGEP